MIMDNTILERPKCDICKEKDAIIGYRHLLVCGGCCLKLNKQEQKWLEEKIKDDF